MELYNRRKQMGSLKPGATYIYEKYKGITYAREFGSEPSTRVPIGWDYDSNKPKDGRDTFIVSKEARLWKDIRETAKTNPALQKALDRAILVYKLVKEQS